MAPGDQCVEIWFGVPSSDPTSTLDGIQLSGALLPVLAHRGDAANDLVDGLGSSPQRPPQ